VAQTFSPTPRWAEGETRWHLAGRAIRGVALGSLSRRFFSPQQLPRVGDCRCAVVAILTTVIFLLCVAQMGPDLY